MTSRSTKSMERDELCSPELVSLQASQNIKENVLQVAKVWWFYWTVWDTASQRLRLLYILVHSQSLAASPATLLHYIFTHILMFQILYIYPLTRDQFMKLICVALKLRFRNSELMKMAPHEVSLMPKRVHGETFSHDCYLKVRLDLFIDNSRNETSLWLVVCHF